MYGALYPLALLVQYYLRVKIWDSGICTMIVLAACPQFLDDNGKEIFINSSSASYSYNDSSRIL